MSKLDDNIWDNILDDIRDQKAVLLIGPEIMRFEGKPLMSYLRESLFEHNPADIAYYYERDGFFLFNSPESKVRVARQVKRFYRALKPDEVLLRKVVQIPFHIVVSLNPDTFLSEAFYRHGIRHRFHYFQHRGRASEGEEVEAPNRAVPLVYNLFGSKDQDDSLVLDYNDVYALLQSVFGATGLPNKFLLALRKASTFIFLGFQFDRWYSQLLLKFLSDGGVLDNQLAANTSIPDADTESFLIQQFKIKFLNDQSNFFQELYDRCSEEQLLRAIVEEDTCPEGVEIRKRIANGETDLALELLTGALKGTGKENAVALLSSRYTSLEQDKDTTDSRDYRVEYNRIVDGMLELVKSVCSDGT